MFERQIRECMARTGAGFEALVYESVGSTNTELARLAREGTAEYTAVIAQAQTAGRGRGEHSFFSPRGSGVYFSLLLRPRFPAETAAKLITPAAAVAAARAIEAVSGRNARIKWVNDIFVGGKKACGILTEAEAGANGRLNWAIPGIGINVSEPEGGYPGELSGTAGAVFESEAPESAAAMLVVLTIENLVGLYEAMPSCGFRDEYARRLIMDERAQGRVVGIDEDFRLLLKGRDGELVALDSMA